MPVLRTKKEVKDYLLAHIEIGPGRCWSWTGRVDRRGYALCYLNGRQERVARVAYEVFVAPIPPGHKIHHTCENPRCIFPDHLLPLTHANHLFLHSLSDTWSGERNSSAKLTEADVQFIRVAKGMLPAQTLVRQFKISVREIFYIWSGHVWLHVKLPEIPKRSLPESKQAIRAIAKRTTGTLLDLQKLRQERGQLPDLELELAILYSKICAVL